jgi:hypothetical protein
MYSSFDERIILVNNDIIDYVYSLLKQKIFPFTYLNFCSLPEKKIDLVKLWDFISYYTRANFLCMISYILLPPALGDKRSFDDIITNHFSYVCNRKYFYTFINYERVSDSFDECMELATTARNATLKSFELILERISSKGEGMYNKLRKKLFKEAYKYSFPTIDEEDGSFDELSVECTNIRGEGKDYNEDEDDY